MVNKYSGQGFSCHNFCCCETVWYCFAFVRWCSCKNPTYMKDIQCCNNDLIFENVIKVLWICFIYVKFC